MSPRWGLNGFHPYINIEMGYMKKGCMQYTPTFFTLCSMPYALCYFPWHCLYFFPLPQGQGSLRPTLGSSRLTVSTTVSGRRPAAAAALFRAASSTRLVRILLRSVFCSLASRTSSAPCIIRCPRDKYEQTSWLILYT